MTAPPPMPNRPAISPVTTPPPRIPATSSAISPNGTPNIMGCPQARIGSGRRGPGRFGVGIPRERQRVEESSGGGPGLHAFGREVAAEGARTRDAMEQAEDMAGHRMEPRATRDLTLDIGNERERRLLGRTERRRHAEQLGVDREQTPRFLIGGAAPHHAADMPQMRDRLVEAPDARVMDRTQRRAGSLPPIARGQDRR